ncbi:hypothetical protein [Variovorax sp. E3]|uniref:hypothetical protein n=1 Tax=Variovorax sp. E3 TaxID=1914993 RepID=UPI0022B6A29B|nr:hypothetical protein [Variovorax sp. E3]
MARVCREHWLIFGNLFAALAAGALASWSTPMMLAVLYVDIWLLANPHIVATYTRIGSMSSHTRLRWALIVVAPILVLAGLTVLALAYEATGLFALYFALQTFHVARQSYGIARRHDRRLQVPFRNLPYLLIYLLPAWGYLHRGAQAPRSFLGYPIWLPPVPQELALAAGIAAIAGSLCWLVCLGYARREPQADAPFNTFVLSHLVISLVGYVWISDITVGWLVVNVWHNIQYLVFVYRQRQPGVGADSVSSEASDTAPAHGKSLLKKLRPPAAFFIGCAICGAALFVAASHIGESLLWLGLPTVLIAHFTLNFHHYLADSVIWKRHRAGRPHGISQC